LSQAGYDLYNSLLPRINILISDDVIFTKVVARLNLNKRHWHFARVFRTVNSTQRDVNRLGFGHEFDLIRGGTFAAEKLEEDHGLKVSRETLRKWMQDAGI